MSIDAEKYPPQPSEVECVMPESAEFQARCFVNGTEWHEKMQRMEPMAGLWSVRFRGHPWVIDAEREGWARDLRSAVVTLVKRAILIGIKPKDIEVTRVMPQKDLVDYWRREAKRTQSAAKWRAENPEHPSIRGLTPIDVAGLLRRLKAQNEKDNQENPQ
jgi:hypothetical protein